MPRLTESRALRASLPQSREAFLWCSEVVGFGARLLKTGVRTYVVNGRCNGKPFRIALGPVGTLAFEGPVDHPGALDLAKAALNAARRGDNPRIAVGRALKPKGVTIADIWQAYDAAGFPLLNGIGHKRLSSITADGYRYRKHIARIAQEPAAEFDDIRVQRWLDTIAHVRARGHALILLKSIMSFGSSRGLCQPHKITLTAAPSRKVQNFLKPDELKRLDAALVDLIAEQPHRVVGFSALRLLLHTGMRKGEVLTLDWAHVDLDHRVIHLPKDKASDTGRDVLLTDAAVEVLRSLPRLARGGWCFPGGRRDGHLVDLEYFWTHALKRAGVRRVRIHDLRHSFASVVIGKGVSIYVTGKLLGHKSSRTSERYAHLSAEAAREAVEKAGEALS